MKAVHVKDFKRRVGTAEGFCDLCEGDVPWDKVVAALEMTGFEGPLTAEMLHDYPVHPDVRCKNASLALDAILGRD